MIVVNIFYLGVVCVLLYLIVNLIRYGFFRTGGAKGGFFALSDKWLNFPSRDAAKEMMEKETTKAVNEKLTKTQQRVEEIVKSSIEKYMAMYFERNLDAFFLNWARRKGLIR